MHLCFIDESGCSHDKRPGYPFCLAGVCIPASSWTKYEHSLRLTKEEFLLGKAEIHCSHLCAEYEEQKRLRDFDRISDPEDRRKACDREMARMLKSCKVHEKSALDAKKKNHEPYWHLTHSERRQLLESIARKFALWEDSFWVTHFDCGPSAKNRHDRYSKSLVTMLLDVQCELGGYSPDAPAPDQVSTTCILVHDITDYAAVAEEYTARFTKIEPRVNLGPTPLFVDSKSTSLLQLADLCAHSIRQRLRWGDDYLLTLMRSRLRSVSARDTL